MNHISGAFRAARLRDKAMENINKKFLSDANVTHVICFDNETVTCYEHTDQSIIALVTRYYEGDLKKVCSVYARSGNVIHNTTPDTGKFNAFFNAYIAAAGYRRDQKYITPACIPSPEVEPMPDGVKIFTGK